MPGKHFPYSHQHNPLTVSILPSNSFLSEISVYDVDEQGQLVGCIGAPIERFVSEAVDKGVADVTTDGKSTNSDSCAAIVIPIHRGGRVVSAVTLSAKEQQDDRDDLVGVLEVWEPVGVYEELGLKSGFFGKMERFRNVSSFVRFEKGTGLPGQVWQQRAAVIHDDLSNHPGFLRAAGASADLLVAAIGIPVASTAYHGSALLISSTVSPLARGMEVWQAEKTGFSLVGGTYRGFGDGIELPPGATMPSDGGLPGLAAESGGAVISEDVETIFARRNADADLPESGCGLAIPFFEGDTLTSVCTLLF